MGGGRKPKPPPPPPAPVAMPTEVSPQVRQKAEAERKRILAALGRRGTILAGLGVSGEGASLLGNVA